MDRLTKEQRRKNMQAVKNKDSKIEQALRNALKEKGLIFAENYNKVVGKPDMIFFKEKVAVFCDSEFWHGKNWKTKKNEIKSNKKFWYKKIEQNIDRDKHVNKELKKRGWKVLRFWGDVIEKKLESCVEKVEKALSSPPKFLKYSDISETFYDDEKFSYITHYFQNKNQFPKKMKKLAISYIQDIPELSFMVKEPSYQLYLPIEFDVPFPPLEEPKFTFVDLFAGIGGFRIAFQELKGKCVFSSEIDKYARITYDANFGEMPFGDITKISEKDIPNHDILLGGFPCQAFSIAGKRDGFNDTRGTLFFDIARIIKEKKPKAFFIENVKGLFNHDRGRTLNVILNTLRNDLKYYVPEPKIINAKDFGVPQNRERIFLVGFRKDLNIQDFKYPNPLRKKVVLKDIKEDREASVKYYLSTQYLDTLRKHRKRHEDKGHGFGYEIIDDDKIANAIVIGGMGKERNLVYDDRLTNYTPVTKIRGKVNREGIRRMTPKEWTRLQGFPDKFRIDVVADTQAYKQLANAVAVPAIKSTGKNIIEKLKGIL